MHSRSIVSPFRTIVVLCVPGGCIKVGALSPDGLSTTEIDHNKINRRSLVWSQLQYYPGRPLLILETEWFPIPWATLEIVFAFAPWCWNPDIYNQVNLLLNAKKFILPLRLCDEQREWKDPNEKQIRNERYLRVRYFNLKPCFKWNQILDSTFISQVWRERKFRGMSRWCIDRSDTSSTCPWLDN